MPRILIIEDEEKIARFIELELVHEGYETEKAADGRTGLEMAESGAYDLVLLDVLLPQLNGMEVLRRLRKTSSVPVILLTARDAVMDKVAGLDAGADDYITKPFAIEELLARIRVTLKHAEPRGSAATEEPQRHVLSAKGVTLDVERHEVLAAGEPVQLTNREFEVLRSLMERPGIVLTRDQLGERALGYDFMGETNIIDVYVRHLRAKIDEKHDIKLIETVRGVGYVIRED